MTWNANVWPANDDEYIYISNYNNLVAAVNERDSETYEGGPYSTKSAGDWIEIGDIVDLRTAVEDIIPYFYDVSTGDVWTKADVLNEAIGQADWSDPSLAANDSIMPRHYNEIKSVLAELMWLRVDSSRDTQNKREGAGSSSISYAWAWSAAKTDYNGNSFAGGTGYLAGFQGNMYYGPTYNATITNWRTDDFSFAVPNYSPDILASKLRIVISDTVGVDTITIYEAANFTGTSHDVTSSGLIDVTTVTKGSTEHFSARLKNSEPDDIDDYDPGGSGNLRFSASDEFLLNKLDFDYQ